LCPSAVDYQRANVIRGTVALDIKSPRWVNELDRVPGVRISTEKLSIRCPEVVAAVAVRNRETVIDSSNAGVVRQLSDVPDQLLIVGNKEAITFYLEYAGIVIERIVLVIEPMTLRFVGIELGFQCQIVGQCPIKP